MEEQFPRCFGHVILEIAVRVFINVHVIEPDFVLFHAGESIGDLAFACAERFYFRAEEDVPASNVSRT